MKELWFDSWHGMKTVQATKPTVHWVLVVQLPECETDCLSDGVHVKNPWSCTSACPCTIMVWCMVKVLVQFYMFHVTLD